MGRQASCKKKKNGGLPPTQKEPKETGTCIPAAYKLGDPWLAQYSGLVPFHAHPHLLIPEPRHPVPPSSCGCSGDDVNRTRHSACLDVGHNTAQAYLALPDSSGNSS